jgi:DNA-binding transcriptional MerR regulator
MLADRPLTIGEVATRFGMTLRALRFYEAKQLVSPQRSGALRLYRPSDCERLRVILTGRRLGFTLAEIAQLLGQPDGKALRLTREQCVAQINFLEQQKRGLEIAIAELRQIYTSSYRKLIGVADPADATARPATAIPPSEYGRTPLDLRREFVTSSNREGGRSCPTGTSGSCKTSMRHSVEATCPQSCST